MAFLQVLEVLLGLLLGQRSGAEQELFAPHKDRIAEFKQTVLPDGTLGIQLKVRHVTPQQLDRAFQVSRFCFGFRGQQTSFVADRIRWVFNQASLERLEGLLPIPDMHVVATQGQESAWPFNAILAAQIVFEQCVGPGEFISGLVVLDGMPQYLRILRGAPFQGCQRFVAFRRLQKALGYALSMGRTLALGSMLGSLLQVASPAFVGLGLQTHRFG